MDERLNDKYLTVTALTRYIKRKIDTDPHLKSVWLKGEISNFKHHNRGHMYLTIKDDQTRIQAVMFAGNNRFLKFTPENGMHVFIKGEVGVFEPYGQYQLYIQQMEPDGIGALYLAYEQLKDKLEKLGYFSKERKKPIPLFPKQIGVVTSPTGAAVRDIITTINRRYPIAQITVIPASVQGDRAALSIKRAIEKANNIGAFDVLIVGRGGGSIEELWSFNEEIVAEAIYRSKIPIISAVGHETDMTISDYVADLRAPTPTGAAELVVPSYKELNQTLIRKRRTLMNAMRLIVQNYDQHLKRLKQSYAFKYPEQLIRQKEQQLDTYSERINKSLSHMIERHNEQFKFLHKRFMSNHPEKTIEESSTKLKQLTKQKNHHMSQIFSTKQQQLSSIMDKLTLLNPLEIMKRGFAIPYTDEGTIITTRDQVNVDDHLSVKVTDGTINCKVLQVKETHDD